MQRFKLNGAKYKLLGINMSLDKLTKRRMAYREANILQIKRQQNCCTSFCIHISKAWNFYRL